MNKDYFKSILIERLNSCLHVRGEEYIIDESIFDNLNGLGCYQVHWSTKWDDSKNKIVYNIKSLVKLKSNSYKISFGKIMIDGLTLYPSQFIEFSLKEERESKLNDLLS
jgi:hypothetical protein